MDNEEEDLDDHGYPNIQEIVEFDKEMSICSSYPFRHKTRLHCAERKAKLFGEWTKKLGDVNFVLYYVLSVST